MNTRQCVQISDRQISNRQISNRQISDKRISDKQLSNSLLNLFEVIPATEIWATIHTPEADQVQHVYYLPGSTPISPNSVEYFSEYMDAAQWSTDPLITDPLITDQMAKEGVLLNLDAPGKIPSWPYLFAYDLERPLLEPPPSGTPCPKASEEHAVSGYWLVWAKEPLTPIHKYCIKQQIQYLCTKQANHHVKEQLRQQVGSLQKMLSRAEHQLRTPLSLIGLCADLLHKHMPTQPLKSQAQFICETVDDMTLSLQRLTHWNDAVGPNRVSCDLKQVVSETIESLKIPLAQNQITITSEARSVVLTLDVWKIKQVLSNLFSNAIAFSPLGSTISCNWHVFQREVLIEICDQGPGFSAEDLAALFTPFYSRRPEGTGLGMVIAKDIINAHQGRLWAANQPTGGAAISIALPRI